MHLPKRWGESARRDESDRATYTLNKLAHSIAVAALLLLLAGVAACSGIDYIPLGHDGQEREKKGEPTKEVADTAATAATTAITATAGEAAVPDSAMRKLKVSGNMATDTRKPGIAPAADTSALASAADTTVADYDNMPDLPLSDNAIEEVVHYKATDSIALNVTDRQAFLYREGDVTYQDMHLTADAVSVDFGLQMMQAYSLKDTNGQITGRPLFQQGDNEYLADTIRFNYSTKKGIISSVITQEGDGFLHGSKVKKMNDSIMYLNRGMYTTCNYAHPHFAMNFTKAKMIVSDKMVSGPAYMSVEDVPTPLAIPFAFFPLTHGRSSGILVPSYGWMNSRGYYLNNGGYYWAINDNLDLSLTGDIYTNLSWEVDVMSNYYRRYGYRGNVAFTYGNTIEGLKGDPTTYNTYSDFKLTWKHQQDNKSNPYSRFSADVNIQSRNYNRNTTNRSDYFSSTTTSSISYSTTLGSNFNLALTARESFNAQTGLMNIKLPSISLNSTTFYPFRRSSPVGGYRWYENISLSYSMAAENNVSSQDSDLFKPRFFNNMNYGIQHSIPISSTLKVLKYFNWTNSITLRERWHWRTIEKNYDTATGTLAIDTLFGFRPNHEASFSTSLSTRLYGMFTFRKGPVSAIRHTINPSISFTFHPDFGSEWMGYWKSYTDNTGYVHRYSIFEQSLYGGPPDGKSGQIRLSIGNNLEMKVRSLKDTTEAPKKITLLESFNISGYYDLAKDSLNWSDLAISARTTLFKSLVLNYSASYSPYVIDESGRKYNRFLWEENKRLFRRQNSNFSAQLSLSLNDNTFKKEDSGKKNEGHLEYPVFQTPYNYNPALMIGTYVDFSVPWNISINYSWTYVNSYIASTYNYNTNITKTLSVSANVSITEKWRVAASTGYDFANKGMSYTSIDIYRDLHCWEMRLNWVPFGYYKSWNFIINIKAPSLRDLKYEKRRSYQDNQGYYSY